MAPRPTGSIVPPDKRRRAWGIRFRAYGKRYTVALGRPEDGWNRQRAELELANVMADVRRGIWRPSPDGSGRAKPDREPTFGMFAEEWLEQVSPEWRQRTCVQRRWLLNGHLLPFFADHPLSTITVKEVDRYRRLKVRKSQELEEVWREQLTKPKEKRKRLPRPLCNGSINKTIRLLATILDQAVEYGYIDRNPARGRKTPSTRIEATHQRGTRPALAAMSTLRADGSALHRRRPTPGFARCS